MQTEHSSKQAMETNHKKTINKSRKAIETTNPHDFNQTTSYNSKRHFHKFSIKSQILVLKIILNIKTPIITKWKFIDVAVLANKNPLRLI